MRLAQSIASAMLLSSVVIVNGNAVWPVAFAKSGDTDESDADKVNSDDDAQVPDPDDPDGGDSDTSSGTDSDSSAVDESDELDDGAADDGLDDSSANDSSGSLSDSGSDLGDDPSGSGEVGGPSDDSGSEDSSVSDDNSGSSGSGSDEPSGSDDDSGSSGSGSSGSGDDSSGDDDKSGSSGSGSSGSDDNSASSNSGSDGSDDSSGDNDKSGSSGTGSGGSDDNSGSSNSGSGGSDDSSGSDDKGGSTGSASSGSSNDSSGSDDSSGSSNSGSSEDNSGSSNSGSGGSSGSGDDSGHQGQDDRSGSDGDSGSASAQSDDDAEDRGTEQPTSPASENVAEVEYLGGGEESEAQRVAHDEQDGIETDREGFRYRRSEFVALDLDDGEISALSKSGFTILQSQRLESAGGTIHLLKGPSRLSDQDAFTVLDEVSDPGSLSFNHLFDSSSGELRKVRGQTVRARSACGCQIGMVDTGVANRLPAFAHVAIEQRAFNADAVSPRQHGTAVANQFAGTAAQQGRPTRIVVADIFSGQRATSGSTFALVRALDWLATKGVGVINVSLAGPRNPVVAGAIERLEKRGHLIVAAAGNDGPAAPPVFPGAYSGVVAVTAVDAQQQVYRYANRGAYVDFAAAGVAVPAINMKGEVTAATGTSFAAPAVAARLARILAQPDPAASIRAVSRLASEARDLGKPGRDPTFGYGLVEDAR